LDKLGNSQDQSAADAETRRLEHEALLAAQRADPEGARNAARAGYEDDFRAARGTSAWGQQLERTFQTSLPSSGQLTSIACRAEVCRVEVACDTAGDSERFVDEIGLDPRFTNLSITWFAGDRKNTDHVMFVRAASTSGLATAP